MEFVCLMFRLSIPFEFPYGETAEIDLATITDRMAVKKAVQNGNVQDAIEKVNDLNPEVPSFCRSCVKQLPFTFPVY